MVGGGELPTMLYNPAKLEAGLKFPKCKQIYDRETYIAM